MTSRLCLAGALAAFAIEGHGTSVSPPCDFTPARNLGAVNSPGFDGSPTVSVNEKTLFFTSDRRGQEDLFVSTRKSRDDSWGDAKNVGPVVNHASGDDFSLRLTPDGRSLYFASAREGNIGSFGIWAATRVRVTDPWDAPRNLGPNVNTASGVTLAPFISDDGRTLYFMSARPESSGSSDCPSGVCFARFDLYASRCE